MALQRLPASGQDELQGGVAFRKERIIPDRIRKRGVNLHAPFFVSVESVGRTFGWRPATFSPLLRKLCRRGRTNRTYRLIRSGAMGNQKKDKDKE